MTEFDSHYLSVPDRQDHYFSVDVETDGPIPGDYSMLSLAVVEAGWHDGMHYIRQSRPRSMYVELQPLPGAKFDLEALRVNKLDREALATEGNNPTKVMPDVLNWVKEMSSGRIPVMVASPAAFDWMFMHWYFIHFAGSSPFGYSRCFDLKTAISVKMNMPLSQSSVKHLPEWLEGGVRRTHNALDDALNQAQAFSNVMDWRGATQASFY